MSPEALRFVQVIVIGLIVLVMLSFWWEHRR